MIDPTTHRTMSERSYHGATSRSISNTVLPYLLTVVEFYLTFVGVSRMTIFHLTGDSHRIALAEHESTYLKTGLHRFVVGWVGGHKLAHITRPTAEKSGVIKTNSSNVDLRNKTHFRVVSYTFYTEIIHKHFIRIGCK